MRAFWIKSQICFEAHLIFVCLYFYWQTKPVLLFCQLGHPILKTASQEKRTMWKYLNFKMIWRFKLCLDYKFSNLSWKQTSGYFNGKFLHWEETMIENEIIFLTENYLRLCLNNIWCGPTFLLWFQMFYVGMIKNARIFLDPPLSRHLVPV